MQTSDVLCVSVCSEGGFFHPLGCSYCLPPLCAGRTGSCEEQPPVRSTQGLGSCVAVPGVMQEACGEVFNPGCHILSWAIVLPQC